MNSDRSMILYLGCQHYNRVIIYKKFFFWCQHYKFFFKGPKTGLMKVFFFLVFFGVLVDTSYLYVDLPLLASFTILLFIKLHLYPHYINNLKNPRVNFEYNYLLNFLIDSSFVELSLNNSTIFRIEFRTSKKKLD